MAGILGFFGNGKEEDRDENMQSKTLVVNVNRCPQNHPCPSIRVCPVGALSQKGFLAPEVDMERCIRCGKCVRYCPMRALSLR